MRLPHTLAAHLGEGASNDGRCLCGVCVLDTIARVADAVQGTPGRRKGLSTGLPISDWPYGRVVVVQSPSIVPVDNQWIAALQRNIDGALEVCKALGADWWGWPA